MNFRRFKDRGWNVASRIAGRVASAPQPLSRAGFAAFGQSLWLAYVAPGSPLRPTMVAFSQVIGRGPPRRLFADFAKGFALFIYRMQRMNLGHEAEIDELLEIPDRNRLDALLEESGVILVMPHANGSLPMVRGLAQVHPVLMIVRSTQNPARAESQHDYYRRLGCDIVDVRRTGDGIVARGVIKALRDGKIVIGTGDLIQKPPPAEAPIDKSRDLVRAMVFGQPAGAPGWPARFALKAAAPLLPVMIEQGENRIALHLGPEAEGGEVVSMTQSWMGGLEALLSRHPSDWAFLFDRRWSKLLARAAAARSAG